MGSFRVPPMIGGKTHKLKIVKVRVIDKVEEMAFVNVVSVNNSGNILQIVTQTKEFNFFTHSVKWYTIEDE